MTATLPTLFLKSLDRLDVGHLELATPDGHVRHFVGIKDGQRARLTLHDWRVVDEVMRGGDVAFAEAYRQGRWTVDDLPALLTLVLQNEHHLQSLMFGGAIARMVGKVFELFRRNTVAGSKRNILAHYDLGNDFYRLWLDPTMTYSSAIYQDGDDLLTAQKRKYDRIIDRLGTQSGRVLEIGCGWGGFADQAVSRGDFDIKGITISDAQYDYARDRLGDRVKIMREDYRHQTGQYDHIVSIEMFEAVGREYWADYFKQLKSLLAEKGRAVVQTITIRPDLFSRYLKRPDFFRTYVFPGGLLPSPDRFALAAAAQGLRPTDIYEFGHDYARTARDWLTGFEAAYDHVRAMGFDDGFIRLWRFYLAACIAGFTVGRINVMQVELQHAH